jgi:hypothetical protein
MHVMVTGAMQSATLFSEYNGNLLSDTDWLHVTGIGVIAQYHSWLDLFWSHGFVYYLRDRAVIDGDNTRAHAFNSEIEAYEHRCP